MSDIEELRRRRLQKLMEQQVAERSQQQIQAQIQQQMREEEASAQIKMIVDGVLSPEARERLANIRLSRPAYARQVEVLLIQLYQAGRLSDKLGDEDFKKILLKLSAATKREIRIKK